MVKKNFKRLIPILFVSFVTMLLFKNTYAKEIYAIVGSEHPWEDSWSKDAKESITLLEGPRTELKVKLVDTKSKPGYIRAVETDTTENLAKGLYEKGGDIITSRRYADTPFDLGRMVDGNKDTYFFYYSPDRPTDRIFWFSLGAQYNVKKVRFYPKVTKEGPDPSKFPSGYDFSPDFIKSFTLWVNDGSPETKNAYGYPIYTRVANMPENKKAFVEIILNPPQKVQWIQLSPAAAIQAKWNIAELEVFGQGFVSAATYVSNIIDLNEPASWGTLNWEAITPQRENSGAKVLIQTRTGKDEDPNLYFRKTGAADEELGYTEAGNLLTKTEWQGLALAERGHLAYDYDNWSPWSAPYAFSAKGSVPITSPGPRRFLQIRIDFINIPDDGGSLKFIEFEFSRPPSATELLGEISPSEVTPAKNTLFTYVVKPTIGSRDTGFNSLEILTPVAISLDQIKSVSVGNTNVDFATFPTEILADPYRLVVHFPPMGRADNGKLIKVEFETMVLRFGTGFDASVFDDKKNEVKQRVVGGDADPNLPSNSLAVNTVLGGSLIASVKASSKTITPNNDGQKDNLEISFNLLQLTGEALVSLKIYDFSGRIVKTVYPGGKKGAISGQYSVIWDGKDENGKIVLPGLYIYQVSVDADSGADTKIGAVVVAY